MSDKKPNENQQSQDLGPLQSMSPDQLGQVIMQSLNNLPANEALAVKQMIVGDLYSEALPKSARQRHYESLADHLEELQQVHSLTVQSLANLERIKELMATNFPNDSLDEVAKVANELRSNLEAAVEADSKLHVEGFETVADVTGRIRRDLESAVEAAEQLPA